MFDPLKLEKVTYWTKEEWTDETSMLIGNAQNRKNIFSLIEEFTKTIEERMKYLFFCNLQRQRKQFCLARFKGLISFCTFERRVFCIPASPLFLNHFFSFQKRF